ncbi:hypothetical protein GGG16DRAFT_64511, partial [Schizophyllum commune]
RASMSVPRKIINTTLCKSINADATQERQCGCHVRASIRTARPTTVPPMCAARTAKWFVDIVVSPWACR